MPDSPAPPPRDAAPANDPAPAPPDEFADLEPPRKRRPRSPMIALAVITFAAWLLWTVREQTAYFFRGNEPIALGEADRAVASRLLRENTHVRIQGTPDRRRAIVIEGRWGGYKGLFPLYRTGGRVFVAQPRKGRQPPGVFTDVWEGRLVRFRGESFFPQVFRYYADKMTSAFDLDAREVLRAAGKAPARLHGKLGEEIEIEGKRELFFDVAFPDQYRLQFDRAKYAAKEECERAVAELGLPWSELPPSRAFHAYLVVAPGDAGHRLLERFRDVALKIGVVPRTESVAAKWADVGAEGNALVVRVAAGGAPPDFTPGADGKLAPAPAALPLVLPLSRILAAEVTAPYRIPMDAFLLLEGDTPRSYGWFFGIDLLLGIVIAGNLIVLALRLRRRFAGEPAAKG